MFKKSFLEILRTLDRSSEQETIILEYKRHSFFLDNNAVVNRISRFMRANVALIGRYSSKKTREFDYTLLQNPEHNLEPEYIQLMSFYLQEYKSFKKGLRNSSIGTYSNVDSFMHYLRKQCEFNISSNDSELADYAIEVTYGNEIAMVEFAWKMFPDGILENITRQASGILRMPVLDDYGDIEYLWNKYAIREYKLEDLYEK